MDRRDFFSLLWIAAALAVVAGWGNAADMPRVAVVVGCLIMSELIAQRRSGDD